MMKLYKLTSLLLACGFATTSFSYELPEQSSGIVFNTNAWFRGENYGMFYFELHPQDSNYLCVYSRNQPIKGLQRSTKNLGKFLTDVPELFDAKDRHRVKLDIRSKAFTWGQSKWNDLRGKETPVQPIDKIKQMTRPVNKEWVQDYFQKAFYNLEDQYLSLVAASKMDFKTHRNKEARKAFITKVSATAAAGAGLFFTSGFLIPAAAIGGGAIFGTGKLIEAGINKVSGGKFDNFKKARKKEKQDEKVAERQAWDSLSEEERQEILQARKEEKEKAKQEREEKRILKEHKAYEKFLTDVNDRLNKMDEVVFEFLQMMSVMPGTLDITPKSTNADWAELVQDVKESLDQGLEIRNIQGFAGIQISNTEFNYKKAEGFLEDMHHAAYSAQLNPNGNNTVASLELMCEGTKTLK